jgi:hypothetical protein
MSQHATTENNGTSTYRSCPQKFAYISLTLMFTFFSVALRTNASYGLRIHEVSKSQTTTHHSRYDSSGRVIGQMQRLLHDHTHQTQQKNTHGPGGIRTRNLSSRAAADLRLRPRGRGDRQNL